MNYLRSNLCTLNIKSFKVFLQKRDFQNYDTKFFGALLPLLNEKRKEFSVPKGKIPVPNAPKGIIKQEFFEVKEKPQKTTWQKIKSWFSKKQSPDKEKSNKTANKKLEQSEQK